jgi:nitrogen fixation protein FixH
MTSTPSTPAEGSSGGWTLTGRHVLGVVVGFFAVIIALNIWFLTLAYRTFPGQVSDTPYEDGLAFNQRLAAQAAQARLGWEAAAAADSRGPWVELSDAEGGPLRGLTVTGRLERPATEAGHRLLAFRETSPGRYEAPAGGLTGAWDLSFRAVDPQGRAFEGRRRLTWP